MEAELVGEVGQVDIIARILGVEVSLGHLVVVGLERPAVPLPAGSPEGPARAAPLEIDWARKPCMDDGGG